MTTIRWAGKAVDGKEVIVGIEIDSNRLRVLHPIDPVSMTKQEMAHDTDINVIMRKWVSQGVIPGTGGREARYGDFSSGMSYHDSLNSVIEMQTTFEALPALVRKACDNDPGKFLDMCEDESRIDELKALGLVEESLPPMVRVMREEAVEEGPGEVSQAGTVGST